MRQIIIAGNWKMNGTVPETETLLRELLDGDSRNDRVTVVVCPPYTALYSANQHLRDTHIALGAQGMSPHKGGAYTGDISADMLLTLGVRYVILGHSERRQYHAETDQMVNAKAKAALSAGLTPIICVGETLDEREGGQTQAVVGDQVSGVLSEFDADSIRKSVIAYEPVWAIGTGKTATPEMAQEVHQFIRAQVARRHDEAAGLLPILYGGSMKPGNAQTLLEQPDIDGGLIGGASLKAGDFIDIINAV